MQPTHASFVSLRTRQAQASAANGLLCIDSTSWLTRPAPNPTEVIWSNVTCPHQQRGLRQLAGWGILALVIIFFFPIIFGLQQIVNLEGYAEEGNWAEWLLDAPLLGSAPRPAFHVWHQLIECSVHIPARTCAHLVPCCFDLDDVTFTDLRSCFQGDRTCVRVRDRLCLLCRGM